MIEQALREILLADAGVQALTDRVYAGVMPQRPTLPLVTIRRVSKASGLTLSRDAAGRNLTRVQVDCWAQDYDGMRALAIAVNGSDDQAQRGPLHGFAGTKAGLRMGIELLAERADLYEPDTKIHHATADYAVRT